MKNICCVGKPLEVKLAMTVLVFRDMSEVDMVRYNMSARLLLNNGRLVFAG